MSQIFIFSDVHANTLALDLVWQEVIRREPSIDASWFLGDALGLGPWPLETLALLREILGEPGANKENVWLAGNHDWGVIEQGIGGSYVMADMNIKVYDKLSPTSEAPMTKHRELLKYDDPNFLKLIEKMPMAQIAPMSQVYLSHAGYTSSPDLEHQSAMIWKYIIDTKDAEKYVYEPIFTEHQLENPSGTILHCCGHYHLQALWRRPLSKPEDNGDKLWEKLPISLNQWIDLEEGYFYHLNPGSVGFPYVQNNGRPCYALLEGNGVPQRVMFKQISCANYDVEEVREKMRAGKYDTSRLKNCNETS